MKHHSIFSAFAIVFFTVCLASFLQGQDLGSLWKVNLPGGVVMYVNPTASAATNLSWGGYTSTVPGTDITALPNYSTTESARNDFNGESNTDAIVKQVGTNNGSLYGAKYCADMVAFGYDDWYLPALGELVEMRKQHGEKMGSATYWSSTENSSAAAFIQLRESSTQAYSEITRAKFVVNICRCVRR